MKLSEKICTCRKKQGLSQEKLAERLGVSRQAVSKWETGESEPEIGKLRLLARTFGVSVDWLLSEEEDEPEKTPEPAPNWAEALPGALGRLIRRYGWLGGVYLAVSGGGILFVGGLARYITRRMMAPWAGMSGMIEVDGEPFYGPMGGAFGGFNPVAAMGTAMMILGAVVLITGVILAIVLKKKSK